MEDPNTIIVPTAKRGNPARFTFVTSSGHSVTAGSPLSFTIARAGRIDQTVSVQWGFFNVTFTPSSGTVVFTPGQVTQSINVTAGGASGSGALKLFNPVYISGEDSYILPELGAIQVVGAAITSSTSSAIYTDVAKEPPILVNPVTITTKAELDTLTLATDSQPIRRFVAGISNSPDSDHYVLRGDGTRDLLLDLSFDDDSTHVTIPFQYHNWKSAIVRGVKTLPSILQQNYAWPTEPYPYPKFPWTMAHRVAIRKHFFLEGCWIKMNGNPASALNSDYTVWKGTYGDVYLDSAMTIQNCLFEGAEGASAGSAGDTMAHQDIWQTQSPPPPPDTRDPLGRPYRLSFDNNVFRSGEQGVSLHGYAQGTGGIRPILYTRNNDFSINDDNAGPFDRGNGIHWSVKDLGFTPSNYSSNITIINTKYTRVFNWQPFMRLDNVINYLCGANVSGAGFIPHPGLEWYPYSTNNPPLFEAVSRLGVGLGNGAYRSPHI